MEITAILAGLQFLASPEAQQLEKQAVQAGFAVTGVGLKIAGGLFGMLHDAISKQNPASPPQPLPKDS